MALTRFLITPQSPWQTALRSDMLNGLTLYRIAEDEGDAAVSAMIERFRSGELPFAFSSAFPHEYLPMPKLPPIPRDIFRELAKAGRYGTDLLETLQLAKAFSKQRWISMHSWLTHKTELSFDALFSDYCKERGERSIAIKEMTEVEPHVSINRATGRVEEGAFFYGETAYFSEGMTLDLYAETSEPEKLLSILKRIGFLGFGKNASSGRGRFDVELDRKFSPKKLSGCPHRLLLSEYSLPTLNGIDGFYSVEVRRGWTGVAMGKNPFKRPFLCLTEGSILWSIPKRSALLEGIHTDPRVVQLVAPVTVPCSLWSENG